MRQSARTRVAINQHKATPVSDALHGPALPLVPKARGASCMVQGARRTTHGAALTTRFVCVLMLVPHRA